MRSAPSWLFSWCVHITNVRLVLHGWFGWQRCSITFTKSNHFTRVRGPKFFLLSVGNDKVMFFKMLSVSHDIFYIMQSPFIHWTRIVTGATALFLPDGYKTFSWGNTPLLGSNFHVFCYFSVMNEPFQGWRNRGDQGGKNFCKINRMVARLTLMPLKVY